MRGRPEQGAQLRAAPKGLRGDARAARPRCHRYGRARGGRLARPPRALMWFCVWLVASLRVLPLMQLFEFDAPRGIRMGEATNPGPRSATDVPPLPTHETQEQSGD
eukprot:7079538-Alexandrium_andersonii.AAC.1